MKKIIYALLPLALLFNSSLSAQTGVRFGLKAGYSMATQYGISPADNTYMVDTHGRNGFAGGVFAYFPITESVGIQQEFIYAMKGSRQNVTINTPVNINTVSEYDLINMGGPPIIAEESGNMKGLDTFDYSFVYGAGTDFKLLNKDFFIEYRMTVGWNTLAMPNASGADPVPLRNQDYIFAVGMYF